MTSDGATLDVSTIYKTFVDYLRIGYIIGDPNVLFASAQGAFTGGVPAPLGSYRSTVPVPAAFASGPRSAIFGLTGYDVEATINFRLRVQDYAQPDGQPASATISTCKHRF